MTLRPYQANCIAAVLAARRAGINRQLIALPTASGKTSVVSALIPRLALQSWEAMLFLVHRDELAEQARRQILYQNPELVVEIEMGDQYADPDCDVVVGSVQTLSRENRAQRFGRDRFNVICIDEAHHSTANSYASVLRYFRALKGDTECDPRVLVLGITATPRRGDGIGLEAIFDKIVYRKKTRDLMDDGYLSKITAYRETTQTDLRSVKTRAGDFVTRQLEEAVNTPERNALVVEKYIHHGAGLPALAYGVDVQHAQDMAAMFKSYGIDARCVHGKTPKEERRELFAAYLRQEFPVLTNCEIATEGVDLPLATVCLLARPTQSSVLFEQIVGRVLRKWPPPEQDTAAWNGYRKASAILVDFADELGDHRIFNTSCLFGLKPSFDFQGRNVQEVMQEIELLEKQRPGLDLRGSANLEAARSMSESVDLFRPAPVPSICRKFSKFAWTEYGEDVYGLSLADRTRLFVSVDQLGQCKVERETTSSKMLIAEFEEAPDAFSFANSLVPEEVIGAALANARWRTKPPSEKQTSLVWKMDTGVRQRFQAPESYHHFCLARCRIKDKAYTKGAFSQRIDVLFRRGR